MTTEDEIRVVCRAICCPEGCKHPENGKVIPVQLCEALGYRHEAEKAIAALNDCREARGNPTVVRLAAWLQASSPGKWPVTLACMRAAVMSFRSAKEGADPTGK